MRVLVAIFVLALLALIWALLAIATHIRRSRRRQRRLREEEALRLAEERAAGDGEGNPDVDPQLTFQERESQPAPATPTIPRLGRWSDPANDDQPPSSSGASAHPPDEDTHIPPPPANGAGASAVTGDPVFNSRDLDRVWQTTSTHRAAAAGIDPDAAWEADLLRLLNADDEAQEAPTEGTPLHLGQPEPAEIVAGDDLGTQGLIAAYVGGDSETIEAAEPSPEAAELPADDTVPHLATAQLATHAEALAPVDVHTSASTEATGSLVEPAPFDSLQHPPYSQFPTARPMDFAVEPEPQLGVFWPAFRSSAAPLIDAPPQTLQQAVAALRDRGLAHTDSPVPFAASSHEVPEPITTFARTAEPHSFPLGASSPQRLTRDISTRHIVAPLRRPDLSVYFNRGSGDLSDPAPARAQARAIARRND